MIIFLLIFFIIIIINLNVNIIIMIVIIINDSYIRTRITNRTPLMMAAEFNQLESVMFLLKHGAMEQINAVDVFGNTALHFAARNAHPDIAQVIFQSILLLSHFGFHRCVFYASVLASCGTIYYTRIIIL